MWKFKEFVLPNEIKKLIGEYFISYITTDKNGFKIAIFDNENDQYDVVCDFGHAVQDYRVTNEGRRLNDHHMSKEISASWLLTEVKNSDYLKKIDKESDGIFLFVNPNLKHYIAGDINYVIDIISRSEPEVYVVKTN